MLCRLGLAGRGLIESLGAAVKGRAPARARGEVTPRRAHHLGVKGVGATDWVSLESEQCPGLQLVRRLASQGTCVARRHRARGSLPLLAFPSPPDWIVPLFLLLFLFPLQWLIQNRGSM